MTTSIMRKKAAAILYNGMCSHINGIDIDQLLAFFSLMHEISFTASHPFDTRGESDERIRWVNEMSRLDVQNNGLNWTELCWATAKPSSAPFFSLVQPPISFPFNPLVRSTNVTINIIKWSSKPSWTIFISNFKCNHKLYIRTYQQDKNEGK